MDGARRQLSLYLPEPERSLVDAVRARIDPQTHGLVPAHVTLCREDEFEDGPALRRLLEGLGPVRVELALDPPRRLADGCVLLPVSGSTESFDRLRVRLLGPAPRPLRPHVTLLHPRSAVGAEWPLDRLRGLDLPRTVSLREVALIEQVDGGAWRVLRTSGP